MKEGEFYKRMGKKATKEELETYPSIMKSDIDEAKRDYPSMASLGLVPKLSQWDIDKIDEAKAKWFVKWFGT